MTIVLFLYANKQNGIALLISIREGKSQREQKNLKIKIHRQTKERSSYQMCSVKKVFLEI